MKKTKIKKSISNKIFISTIIFLLTFTLIQVVFQYFFLEKYYISKKTNSIETMISGLSDILLQDNLTYSSISEYLSDLSQKNNASIGIVDMYGQISYGFVEDFTPSYITVSADGTDYKILVENFLKNSNFQSLLKQNKYIAVVGQLTDSENNEIFPSKIIIDNHEFNMDKQTYSSVIIGSSSGKNMEIAAFNSMSDKNYSEQAVAYFEVQKISSISIVGKISNIQLADIDKYSKSYQNTLMFEEVAYFMGMDFNYDGLFESNQLYNYTKTDTATGIKYLVYVKPVMVKSNPMLLFTLSSLETADEISNVSNDFTVIILIIMSLLALLSSWIYSKNIVKPLIKISSITEDMANLNFSNKLKVNSQDEIGMLSQSINELSDQLNKTLNELNQANKQLNSDIEFRKKFMSNISHELKTPLTVIRGICEGMQNGVYEMSDPDNFNRILCQADDMNKLIFEILEVSKCENASLDSEKQLFDISEITAKVCYNLKPLFAQKNISLTNNIDECFVYANEYQIEAVLKNLISNGILYSPADSSVVLNCISDENKATVSVENSNVQIPENEIKNLFEPFYRLEKSRNKKLGGTGLGLYIVKQYLEHNSSYATIENTEIGVKVSFALICHQD